MQLFVLKILNIRPEESWYVRTLFLHHFFQGIGVALFFTLANALFLSNYPIQTLAQVYLAAGLLLLVAGRIYAHYEHHSPVEKLLPGVVMVMAFSVALLRLTLGVFDPLWMPFLLLVWYYVIYLLGSLEFWGLSALLFDVRQSKRLFGLISAGDIPAKLLGYLSVSVLVPVIGLENLAWVAGGSFVVSLFFLKKLLRKKTALEEAQSKHHHHDAHHHEAPENLSGRAIAFRRFFGNDFILSMAGLSFLAVLVLTFIDFAFLSEVKYRYKDEAELASFLGIFFSIGKGVIIFLKVFFSGRLIDRLGARRALLILPSFLIVLALVLLASYITPYGHTQFLILFGLMTLVGDIFSYALHDPVFLALFQPLNEHLRLQAHTVIKGVVNPVALGLAGLVLVGLYELYAHVSLSGLNTALLLPLGGWMVMIFVANGKYLEVLSYAVRKHYLRGSQLSIQDGSTVRLLTHKLESPHTEEVIYALELLEKTGREDFEEVLKKMLRHEKPEIRFHALSRIESLQLRNLGREVLVLVHAQSDPSVREAAIRAYCRINEEQAFDQIQPYLQSEDPQLHRGAITGLLKTGGIEATVFAGQELLRLIESEKSKDKALAASIIGDLRIRRFYQPLVQFLQDGDHLVRQEALLASGKVANPQLLPYLTPYLDQRDDLGLALRSLTGFGEDAITWVETQLSNVQADPPRLARFARMAQQIGGDRSVRFLLKLMEQPYAQVRNAAIAALKILDPSLNPDQEQAVGRQLEREILFTFRLFYLKFLLENKDDIHHRLYQALTLELQLSKRRLFELVCLFFENYILAEAREGLLEDTSKQANALEILDNLLSKMWMDRLVLIFDDLPIRERLDKIGNYARFSEVDQKGLPVDILEYGTAYFEHWTLALALVSLPHQEQAVREPLAAKYADSGVLILQQSARMALQAATSEAPDIREMAMLTGFSSEYTAEMKMTDPQANTLLELEKVLILKGTPMFAETPENVLVDLAGIVREERVETNTRIFSKGDEGYCMYIIYEGAVKIHDGELTFAHFSRKDFFGELSLLDPEPRSASATTEEETLLLRLDQQPFYELMNERTEVARGILSVLCQRLRKQNQMLASANK